MKPRTVKSVNSKKAKHKKSVNASTAIHSIPNLFYVNEIDPT